MKILFYILIIAPFFAFSQIKSGTITYGISYTFEEDLRKGLMSNYVESAMQNAKYVTFNLDFNSEAMRFYPMENMVSDGQNKSFALAFCSCEGVYYKTKNLETILHEFDNENFGNIILSSKNKLEWELTNDTKMINNFLCYRANSVQVVDNGTEIFKFPIIAWYCPEIPFPYGPKEYGGLPGLILELQERNALFGVTKIELNSTEEKVILKPSKGKVITENEFSKMIDEYFEALKD